MRLVSVWIYTSQVEERVENGGNVYLYPVESEYMTQLFVPIEKLKDFSESKGVAVLKK